MIDALLVWAVNSFETIGVFVVLLSTRGCCNQEDQCVSQREYGFVDDRKCQMSSQSYEQLCRIPRAARSLSLSLQVAVGRKKADSEREQHQPRKVLCSVGVACLSSERVQEAIEGMVVARWINNYWKKAIRRPATTPWTWRRLHT